MSTKKLSGILIVCLLLTGGAMVTASDAQPPGGNGGPGGGGGGRGGPGGQPPALPDSTRIVQMVGGMAKSLSLTDEQQEQVLELHFAHFAEVGEKMAGAKGDRENHRKQMDALRAEFEKDVKALLSDEQQAQFDELMKKNGRPDKRSSGQSGQSGQRRR